MEEQDLLFFVTKMLDKDEPVFIHGELVARISCAIAKNMKYPDEEVKIIRQAGFVHDIGKLQLPDEIINKPGRLSLAEFTVVKNHAQIGYCLLQRIKADIAVAKVALQHHERLDGSGYPFGLRGEAIIPAARIVAVADIVAAMISPRPYRAALDVSQAAQEISRGSGLLYDRQIVDICLLLIKKGKICI